MRQILCQQSNLLVRCYTVNMCT